MRNYIYLYSSCIELPTLTPTFSPSDVVTHYGWISLQHFLSDSSWVYTSGMINSPGEFPNCSYTALRLSSKLGKSFLFETWKVIFEFKVEVYKQ